MNNSHLHDTVENTHLVIGRIVGIHGVRGEIKVEVMTDFPERFQEGAYLKVEDDMHARRIESVRPHKALLLVKLEGFDNRNDVEHLRRRYLVIDRDEAGELGEDEYYVHELIGLQVFTDSGILLGLLTDVLWTGANEVYVVQGDYGEVLVPAIADVVQEVDLKTNRMNIKLLSGLIQALDR